MPRMTPDEERELVERIDRGDEDPDTWEELPSVPADAPQPSKRLGAVLSVRLDPDLAEALFGRPIPGALALDPATDVGTAAEEASREAASLWGLPDFVLTPEEERSPEGDRRLHGRRRFPSTRGAGEASDAAGGG